MKAQPHGQPERNLIALRKENDAFSGGDLVTIPTENDHVLGFIRTHDGQRAVILANFSEHAQTLSPQVLKPHSLHEKNRRYGLSQFSSDTDVVLAPLDFMVFVD